MSLNIKDAVYGLGEKLGIDMSSAPASNIADMIDYISNGVGAHTGVIAEAIDKLELGGGELPSGLKIAHVTIVTKEPPADWGPQGPRRDDYLNSGFDLQTTEFEYGGSMVGSNFLVNLSASGFYQLGVTSESSPKEILVIYFGDFTDLIILTGDTTIGGSSFEEVDLNGDVTLTEDKDNHYVRISGDCTISAYPTYWV